MALLARFACGDTRRVEIPAPVEVRCERHPHAAARLISLPSGQVRYLTLPTSRRPAPSEPAPEGDAGA